MQKIESLLPFATPMNLNREKGGEKGLLLVYCGVDGSGKSSAIKTSQEDLNRRGISHVVFKSHVGDAPYWESTMLSKHQLEEDGVDWPADADRVLQVAEFLANVRYVLPQLLTQYAVVLSDRYDVAKLVYARIRHNGKIGTAEQMLRLAKDIPQPNVFFFFKISPEIADKRIELRVKNASGTRDWKENYTTLIQAMQWYTYFFSQKDKVSRTIEIDSDREFNEVQK